MPNSIDVESEKCSQQVWTFRPNPDSISEKLKQKSWRAPWVSTKSTYEIKLFFLSGSFVWCKILLLLLLMMMMMIMIMIDDGCCVSCLPLSCVIAVGNWSWSDVYAINTCPEHIHGAAVHRPLHYVWLWLSSVFCASATHPGLWSTLYGVIWVLLVVLLSLCEDLDLVPVRSPNITDYVKWKRYTLPPSVSTFRPMRLFPGFGAVWRNGWIIAQQTSA